MSFPSVKIDSPAPSADLALSGWEQILCAACKCDLYIRPEELRRFPGTAIKCLSCVARHKLPVPVSPTAAPQEGSLTPEGERLAVELAAIEARIWDPADGPDPDGMFERWAERISR